MVLKNIIPSVMAQIDFVKDLLQVALLTLAVGGPSYVLGNASSFSSVVKKRLKNHIETIYLHYYTYLDLYF